MAGPAFSSPEWYRNLRDADISTDIGRLTIYHLGFRQATDGALIFPPLDFSTTPRAVLDVGTADGLWMRDVQSSLATPPHGTHTFTGTDLNSSFFPGTIPPNMTFVQQDINAAPPSSWQASFDLVHMRMILIAAGSGERQRAVVDEHIRLVRPGGWVQIGDCDRVCPTPEGENPRYHDMFACIRAVCQASGAAPLEAPKMRRWLEEAGLEDVQERVVMRAVGRRNVADEELGRRGIEADLIIARAFAGAAKALDQSLKPLPDERLDTLEVDLEKELNEIGAFFPMRFIWGRKPL